MNTGNKNIKKVKRGRSETNDYQEYRRTVSFDIKLSPYEKTRIENLYDSAGFNSMASYVRNRIFNGKEKFIDDFFEEKFKYGLLNNSFLGEIKRIGNNLNQQTKKINSAKFFTDDDKQKLFLELTLIKNEMEKLTNLIQKKKEEK